MSAALTPASLSEQARRRGVVVLAVTCDSERPDVLIAYLHGLAGQSGSGDARRAIRGIPGVISVADSTVSASILEVQISLD